MTAHDGDPGIGTVYVTVEHLARLEARARGLAFLPRQGRRSILAGRHASRLRGRGLDFDEIRAYVPGDDVRSLDWKATLRTGSPQIRAYTEERDRPALFVVDQRLSMFFGSTRAMKSVVAAELGALGAWMVLHAGDRVGAVVFDDQHITRIRPHRSRGRVQEILGAITAMNRTLRADSPTRPDPAQLDRALEGVLQLAAHDHLICVISDFAGAGSRTRQLLRALAAHNDVIAALVFDPLARSTTARAHFVVTDGTLQVALDLAKGSVREPLARFFAGRLADVGTLLQQSGVPMMALDTATETSEQLRHLLGRDRRRAR